MRYLVRCSNCSHSEFWCAELRPDQCCPHCQSVPGSYVIDGVDHCWLHRLPFSGSYLVSDIHLFTVYGWRGHESTFPYAKLYEASDSERASGTSTFCPGCQAEYERWLAAECQDDSAAEAEDEADSRRG